MSRTMASACSSFSARWSTTPDLRRVEVAAAEILGRDHLAGRRLHQRRAAEEDRALVADDHALVRHRRHIGAAGGAAAHHAGDLGDALRPTSAPGCRRSGRNARGRGRPRPGAAGWRRRCRPDRRRAAGSAARSPAPADASSPSSGNRRRPSPSGRWRRSSTRGPRPGRCRRSSRRPAPRPRTCRWRRAGRSRGRASRDRAAASTRSRGSSLPRDDMALAMLLGAAERGLRDLVAQLVGERAIVRGISGGKSSEPSSILLVSARHAGCSGARLLADQVAVDADHVDREQDDVLGADPLRLRRSRKPQVIKRPRRCTKITNAQPVARRPRSSDTISAATRPRWRRTIRGRRSAPCSFVGSRHGEAD